MSTRASIKFIDKDGNFLANVYHHYDGYPQYLGAKLLELTSSKMVNGLPSTMVVGELFNGMECLVASVISRLKTQPGNVYIYPESAFGQSDEDYLYMVVEDHIGTRVSITVSKDNGENWEDVEKVLKLDKEKQ
jgi:hypothetical protein